MKIIIVPLDGSREAEAVLPCVPALARRLAARVELLRVVPNSVSEGMRAQTGSGSLEVEYRRVAGEHEETLRDLRAQSLEAELVVEAGHPAEVILERATMQHATLIAMATHGYSGLRRWALGSVTDKVVHAAEMPVFVIRSAMEPPSELALRRILVPIDSSALSRSALTLATRLAADGGELLLFHVLVPPVVLGNADGYIGVDIAQLYADPTNETRLRAIAELQALASQLQAEHGVSVRYGVGVGLAASQIIEAAEHHDCDLVVMATHGYSGLKRWALGSVADKVLHACPRPLILVRAQAAV
jgi:nucleotide-binding universal stress UspA family protein